MLIRKTLPEEIGAIMKIYEHARLFMASHGNPLQWGNSYPSLRLIEEDVRAGCSYVCTEHDKIIAAFYYQFGPDDTYARIYNGQWLNEAPYGVVHRIASDGTMKGAATCCLDWALSQCGNLKIDTHRDNLIMQNLLAKKGFTYCGIIYTETSDERLAYQKTK